MSEAPLPPQDVLRATCLRPGRSVDLILQTNLDNNQIDVRPSALHEVDAKGRLILAQTKPRVKPSFKGRQMEITFLASYKDVPGGRWLRVGYEAPLIAVLENYKLQSGLSEQALVVSGPHKLDICTLRLDYRLEPTLDSALELCFWPDETPLTIVDISAGGVRFSHSAAWSFVPGQKLSLAVKSRDETLVLSGRVKRSGEMEGPASRRLSFTAVQFEEMELAVRQRLSQLIQEALRRQLARQSGFSELRTVP
jgi:hypothetical protein